MSGHSGWGIHIGLTSVMAAFFAGCGSVDPAADYQRAAQHAAQATGHDVACRPDDDSAIASRVDALLADGLTADEAVHVALLNNSSLQAAWLTVGMARADFVQAGLFSNPSLGGSLRFPAGGGLANLEVSMAQNIADLWQIPSRQRTAQAEVEQAVLELAGKAADLAADTRSAYYRAVGAGDLHHVAGENLAIAEQLLELAIGRQQAGAGSELDVNLSRSAVLEAQLAVESARFAAAEERRSLARLLGLAVDPDMLNLSDSFPQTLDVRFHAERLIEHSRQRRLDIRAAEQGVARAQSRVAEEYLKIFPTLELGVAMERGERKAQPGRKILADTARASVANGALTAPEIQPRSERSRNTDFIIGPGWNLVLPIFDQNQAQIAKARYALDQAGKELESIDRCMVQEVRGATDRLATAWNVAALYRDRFIPLAQENLELSRESYRVGRASFLSVLEAQRFYLDTRRRSIEALQAAATAIPELERVTASPIAELTRLLAEPSGSPASASRPAGGGQP